MCSEKPSLTAHTTRKYQAAVALSNLCSSEEPPGVGEDEPNAIAAPLDTLRCDLAAYAYLSTGRPHLFHLVNLPQHFHCKTQTPCHSRQIV